MVLSLPTNLPFLRLRLQSLGRVRSSERRSCLRPEITAKGLRNIDGGRMDGEDRCTKLFHRHLLPLIAGRLRYYLWCSTNLSRGRKQAEEVGTLRPLPLRHSKEWKYHTFNHLQQIKPVLLQSSSSTTKPIPAPPTFNLFTLSSAREFQSSAWISTLCHFTVA